MSKSEKEKLEQEEISIEEMDKVTGGGKGSLEDDWTKWPICPKVNTLDCPGKKCPLYRLRCNDGHYLTYGHM